MKSNYKRERDSEADNNSEEHKTNTISNPDCESE
jgi:hypothetical protein